MWRCGGVKYVLHGRSTGPVATMCLADVLNAEKHARAKARTMHARGFGIAAPGSQLRAACYESIYWGELLAPGS